VWWRAGVVGIVLGLAQIIGPRSARAGEPAVRYVAPEPCPHGDTFRAELRALLEASGSALDSFAFDITITSAGDGFRGTLRATAPSSQGPAREVEDVSCSALVRALAFIAAVVVDPTVAERVSAQEASAAFGRDEPAKPEAVPMPQLQEEPPPPLPAAAPPRTPVERKGPVEHGFRAGLLGAPALETSLGPDVALEARLGVYGATAQAWSGVGWLAGLSFVHGSSDSIATHAGDAELSWTRGRGDGCLSLPLVKPLLLYTCAFVDVGVISGTGQISPIKSRRALWLAPGLLGRLAVEFANYFEFFVEGGTFTPLVRPRFFFTTPSGDAVVHSVPALGFTSAAGLTVRVL
jgi:hypothetical protein